MQVAVIKYKCTVSALMFHRLSIALQFNKLPCYQYFVETKCHTPSVICSLRGYFTVHAILLRGFVTAEHPLKTTHAEFICRVSASLIKTNVL